MSCFAVLSLADEIAVHSVVRLSPLEATIDTPVGERDSAPPLLEIDPRLRPLEALERVVRSALQHPPCLVDFSGGRDSSAVLAVAARVARKEGLPLPIPSTDRFPGRPETEESRWQELVIRHLDLPDWRRRTLQNELDLIGPVARRVMSRHGLISPCTAYAKLPSLEDAVGGTVVTGLEGDGLFGGWTFSRAWSVLAGRARPTPRDLLRIARVAAPATARRSLLQRRLSLDARWLLPAAAADLERRLVHELAGEPRRWDLWVDWWARSRVLAALRDGLGVVARDVGTRLVHPLLDPTFLAAMARTGSRSGIGDRTRVMLAIFGELLPPQVLSRRDKANFTFVYFTDECRAFAERWNGDGVPCDLVDPEKLRATWQLGPPASPDMRSGLLLQAAWLASSGSEVQRHFNCDIE